MADGKLALAQEAIRLNNLAIQLHGQGKLAHAAQAAQASIASLGHHLGAAHVAMAPLLQNLAVIYRAQQSWDAAESALLRALAIVENARGPADPELLASVLGDLGRLFSQRGAHAQAESLLLRALGIREQALGATHLDVAETLMALGNVHLGQTAYAQAKPMFERALGIREDALGTAHPDTARSLLALSLAHQELGAYAMAESLLARALAIFESEPNRRNDDIATCLNNLAELYKAQGAATAARPLLERALALYEAARGPRHPVVAAALHNLAANYQHDRAPEATALYERAIAIHEATPGAMHPHLAICLSSLASHRRRQQDYEPAERLYRRAIEILEHALGGMHPELGRSVAAMADLHKERGNLDQAESLYVRALEITERTLGTAHPDVAARLYDLAALNGRRGDHKNALAAMARAAEITEGRLHRELVALPGRRKHALLNAVRGETQSIVSLHADAMPTSPEALELALAMVVRRKCRAVDSLVHSQVNRLVETRPELRDKAQELTTARARVSSWFRRSFAPEGLRMFFEELEALRTHAEGLEAELSAQAAELRPSPEMVTVPAIRTRLPHGAALVEFIRYRRFEPTDNDVWREPRYAAYVLPSQGPARWAALGPADAIDAAIDTMLVEMRAHREHPVAEALQRLYALVFEPIEGWLTDAWHIIVSPDDKLNLVPFEALQDSEGNYVLESWLVSYVGTGRDLVRPREQCAPRSIATIVAAPDYGAPRSTGRGPTFRSLDGTRREATELPSYLPRVRTLTGPHATKAALAATVGPSVLHIATHGYFDRSGFTLAPSETTPRAAAHSADRAMEPRDVVGMDPELVPDAGSSTFVPFPPRYEFMVDPLERAGLALAGANDESDGVVTARELANYDWRGTQLVVLSACDTGVGSVISGEGIYGMRHALMLAGTETQVVSLWNVSDSSTADLMREFYGELARGIGRAEALRRAKLRLLDLARFRHPYYWAAFILAGDWTPLANDVVRTIDHGEALPTAAVARSVSSSGTSAEGPPATSAPLIPDTTTPQPSVPDPVPTNRGLPLPAELEPMVVLLMTSEQLGSRADTSEMTDLITSVFDDIAGLYARGEILPAAISVFFAIKPVRQLKVWVDGIDCELAAEDAARIERWSNAWRAPAVSRPVTFACVVSRKDQARPGLPRLPRAWREAAREADKTLMLPDDMVAAVWPD